MTTYSLCKQVILKGNYKNKEEMMNKLDVFLLNDRFTQEQYEELVALLNEKEASKG